MFCYLLKNALLIVIFENNNMRLILLKTISHFQISIRGEFWKRLEERAWCRYKLTTETVRTTLNALSSQTNTNKRNKWDWRKHITTIIQRKTRRTRALLLNIIKTTQSTTLFDVVRTSVTTNIYIYFFYFVIYSQINVETFILFQLHLIFIDILIIHFNPQIV